MKDIKISISWHKVDSPEAMTNKQFKYINSLLTDENCPEWPFNSTTNACRSLTKADASEIIDALKAGDRIIFE